MARCHVDRDAHEANAIEPCRFRRRRHMARMTHDAETVGENDRVGGAVTSRRQCLEVAPYESLIGSEARTL